MRLFDLKKITWAVKEMSIEANILFQAVTLRMP